MSFNPENSAIRVDAVLEEKLKGASFEEIKAHLANAAVQQGLVRRDIYDSSVLIPIETVPQKFAQAITDPTTGEEVIFEGDSELDVARRANAYMREHFSQPTATAQPRDEATGRFGEQGRRRETGTVEVDRLAGLKLQLQLGQIDVATYLEQSGAIDSYLAEQGVDMDSLREVSSKKTTQSWTDAVETFRSRHAEWVGGDANRDLIGKIIAENGLLDADPLEALEAAYNHAKENGLLVPNEEAEQYARIAEARSPSELAAILQIPERQKAIMEIQQSGGSGLFGR